MEIDIGPDGHGSIVQECEVGSNPWPVRVWWDAGRHYVEVTRGDESE